MKNYRKSKLWWAKWCEIHHTYYGGFPRCPLCYPEELNKK